MTTRFRALVALLASLAVLVAACASDEAEDTAADDTTAEESTVEESTAEASADEPVSEDADSAEEAAAEDSAAEEGAATEGEELRVVSLSPTHTEIMFAIGAGDLLVAVDDYSNYPAEAAELPNDLSGFEPNVEAIAGYEPDLVLIGGDFTGLGDQLSEVGIDSWDGPAATSFDDIYAQIEQLGAATGHIAEAAELVAQMQTDLDAAVEGAPSGEGLTYYHELDATFYSADSTTFVGSVYGLFGLDNIADPEGAEAFGYPQLNAEYIVEANPDMIFTTDGEDLDAVAARDGWAEIAAVANGNVFVMDADIASRWGPRIVDYVEAVAAALQQATVGAN